jgi:hypothetical protein
LDFSRVPQYWDQWVHLLASVHSGHTSAISVLARFGSAARGDPLYEVGVGIGRLLRTVFLADYFVNPVFRRELLRVLNRGAATNVMRAEEIKAPLLKGIAACISLRGIARRLTNSGCTTSRESEWTATAVSRAIDRLGLKR